MKEPVTLVRSIRQRLIAHFEKTSRLPRKKLLLRRVDSCFMRRSPDASEH